MKNEIELRLQGSLLSDWCAQKATQSEHFVYQRGFDSTHRIIRFSTQTLDSLFTMSGTQSGHWKNGRAAMYEIRNGAEDIILPASPAQQDSISVNGRGCSDWPRPAAQRFRMASIRWRIGI